MLEQQVPLVLSEVFLRLVAVRAVPARGRRALPAPDLLLVGRGTPMEYGLACRPERQRAERAEVGRGHCVGGAALVVGGLVVCELVALQRDQRAHDLAAGAAAQATLVVVRG